MLPLFKYKCSTSTWNVINFVSVNALWCKICLSQMKSCKVPCALKVWGLFGVSQHFKLKILVRSAMFPLKKCGFWFLCVVHFTSILTYSLESMVVELWIHKYQSVLRTCHAYILISLEVTCVIIRKYGFYPKPAVDRYFL